MRRLRLASLALASTILLIVSGCASTNNSCDDSGGRFFSRFFNRSSASPGLFSRGNGNVIHGGAECECQQPGFSPGFSPGMMVPPGQGPFIGPMPHGVSNPQPPIPVTNAHVNQPPFLKVPNAPPTAYSPSGH
jgi:hypothetical protein